MHHPSQATNYLGLRYQHGTRLLHGFIVATWSRLGIIWNRIFFDNGLLGSNEVHHLPEREGPKL
jgi:hypothetical protein